MVDLTDEHIRQIAETAKRVLLRIENEEQRTEALAHITAGFCLHCGRYDPEDRPCHCENDE